MLVTMICFFMAGKTDTLILCWLVPFVCFLPIIRYIGEVTKHGAFICSSNELYSTRNNFGWINENIIHPRGDAYHIIHHLYPKLPFYRMKNAHNILLGDANYASARHVKSFLNSLKDLTAK
jgi:fatty acid desaturase